MHMRVIQWILLQLLVLVPKHCRSGRIGGQKVIDLDVALVPGGSNSGGCVHTTRNALFGAALTGASVAASQFRFGASYTSARCSASHGVSGGCRRLFAGTMNIGVAFEKIAMFLSEKEWLIKYGSGDIYRLAKPLPHVLHAKGLSRVSSPVLSSSRS